MFKTVIERVPHARARYQSYVKTHRVYAILHFAFFLIGVLVCTFFCLTGEGIDACIAFRAHWETRLAHSVLQDALWAFQIVLPGLALSFIFGVTIYAPLVGGLTSIVSGFLCGAYLRFLIEYLVETPRFEYLLFYAASLVLLIPALLAICAFASAVSVKLFTKKARGVKETDTAFGGTLFCAPYFEGCINLRFLASYLLIFSGFAVVLFCLCLIQALIFSLI